MVNFRGFLRNLPLNTELMRDFLAEHLFDPDSLNAISATVSAFYLKRFGYGRHHKPYVVSRHVEVSILLVIDFPTTRAIVLAGNMGLSGAAR
ncbi:hypothetical protein [Ferrovum sp.]|jgi:hypothetical protein|uniref:hypothetical protein n=1 Tax=Ferrovum sp. TaxID=2609467 RepID=UPI0026056597|nr:hypothetical protein [Ferrovum sp.]